MTIELPALRYARDALVPHISPETIDFHYQTMGGTHGFFDRGCVAVQTFGNKNAAWNGKLSPYFEGKP